MINIFSIHDNNFQRYGIVVKNLAVQAICAEAAKISMPDQGVVYEPSLAQLEETVDFVGFVQYMQEDVKIQAGLCWGHNRQMNAMEYHQSNEINIAVTDLLLILGDRRDIRNSQYDSALAEAFYVPKGTVIDLYPTTLHFAPCSAGPSGFRAIIILPRGTNQLLDVSKQQTSGRTANNDDLLFAQNKWLIAHPEFVELKQNGAHPGIVGENYEIPYITGRTAKI